MCLYIKGGIYRSTSTSDSLRMVSFRGIIKLSCILGVNSGGVDFLSGKGKKEYERKVLDKTQSGRYYLYN